MTGHDHPPNLRIVRGDPTAEEIAALVVVLAGTTGASDTHAPAQPQSQWAPPARLLRQPLSPTGWWESALPR